MKALVIVLFLSAAAVAAPEDNGRGTKAISLANACVAIADDPWAISYNAAGLAQIPSVQISAFYIPRQFGLSELRTSALGASIRINPGTAGISIERFGFDLYHTTTLRVGYGGFLVSTLAMGMALNVQRISIERYGSANAAALDIGFLGWPTPHLALGFCLKNATATTLGRLHERLPESLAFGLAYTPTNDFLIVTELEKELEYPLVLKAGIEQTFLDFLSLRCGISNNPDKFSLGFAVRYAGMEFGYAGYSHTELGWTHQIDITVRWN